MIAILITIIFVLCITVIFLIIDFYREKNVFKKKIQALEDVIVHITRKHIVQGDQLRISDDMNQNFKISKTVLNNDIFNLNYELFEILSKNNLLNKE